MDVAHYTNLCKLAKNYILASEMSPCPDKIRIDRRIAQEHVRIILMARDHGLERPVFDACTSQWTPSWASSSIYRAAGIALPRTTLPNSLA